jgi:hypothetical protein
MDLSTRKAIASTSTAEILEKVVAATFDRRGMNFHIMNDPAVSQGKCHRRSTLARWEGDSREICLLGTPDKNAKIEEFLLNLNDDQRVYRTDAHETSRTKANEMPRIYFDVMPCAVVRNLQALRRRARGQAQTDSDDEVVPKVCQPLTKSRVTSRRVLSAMRARQIWSESLSLLTLALRASSAGRRQRCEQMKKPNLMSTSPSPRRIETLLRIFAMPFRSSLMSWITPSLKQCLLRL